MLRRILGISAVTVILGSPALPARAALFDFESIAPGPTLVTTPLSLTSAGLSAGFTGSALGDPGAFAVSYNSTSGPLRLFQGLQDAFLGSSPATSLDLSSPLTISFSAPVTSLSLNFALGIGAGTLTLTTSAGGSATFAGTVPAGFAYGEGTASFTGAAFRSVTLRSSASTGLEVDNINATPSAAAVPEPASVLLLVSVGLGAAGLRRRRA